VPAGTEVDGAAAKLVTGREGQVDVLVAGHAQFALEVEGPIAVGGEIRILCQRLGPNWSGGGVVQFPALQRDERPVNRPRRACRIVKCTGIGVGGGDLLAKFRGFFRRRVRQ
jgi:hypothetical protein